MALVAGIKTREAIARFVTQQPLIDTASSLEGIAGLSEASGVFFGVGLCNGNNVLSDGLPVDVLAMLLTAEHIDAPKYILIADTHAVSNGLDQKAVDETARRTQATLQRTIDNLGLQGWEIIRASEIDRTPAYQAILTKIPEENEYIRRQLADMAWFVQERGVNIKVGWVLEGSKNADERMFDQEFRRQVGLPLSSIYTEQGRTFNETRCRVPPYHCADREDRILLEEGEDVAMKIAAARLRGEISTQAQQRVDACENFLKRVVRLYSETVERTEGKDIDVRLQHVVDRCTQ